MSDYFETDEIVKSYDGAIFRRLVAYLKPHKALAALVIASLVIASAGELLVPVIEQRLLDGAVVPRFVTLLLPPDGASISLSPAARHELARLRAGKNAQSLMARDGSEYVFVRQDAHFSLQAAAERELRGAGILLNEDWYAFRLSARDKAFPALKSAIKNNSLLFLLDTRNPEMVAGAVKQSSLSTLSPAEIAAVRRGDLHSLSVTIALLLAALVLVFGATFLQVWSAALAGQLVMKDIRLALIQKTITQSTAFLSRHPIGRLVTRLTGDVETVNQFFTDVVAAFLKDFSIMAGCLVTLIYLSPRLSLCILVILPLVVVMANLSRRRARDAFRRQRAASGAVNAFLSERLSGIQVVQLFRGEEKSRRRFAALNGELLAANIDEMFVYATFRPVIEFLGTLCTAAVITFASLLILRMQVSLGVVIAYISLIGMFFGPVNDIAEKYTILQAAMAGGERVFRLLDVDERIEDIGERREESNPRSSILNPIRGHIEFDNVHFSYTKKPLEEVLRGLSFSVLPGETAAIVGYTGAGKTTITNVFTRLWEIDRGEIRLDGVPIQNMPLADLRRAALPVLQEVFLFGGSVADNISLGLPLTRAEIENAARAVHAHEFIALLPDGYDTRLSEGATNISAGQRQLLSFARVIAHNPAIVILDEATSSIDTETERLVQLGIKNVLHGRTSIVIAHRLSTIRGADRIFVLAGGRVVEEGTHEALLARGGRYAALYRLQFAEAA